MMIRNDLPAARRRSAALALAAAAVLVSTSACGSSSSGAKAQSHPVLTLALQSAPTSLDPSKGSGGGNAVFQDPAYQGLLHVTGASDTNGSLASSYQWVGTGNTTLQVTLLPGLKFSDGTPLDAAAVKASIQHFATNGSVFSYVAAPIASIDTPSTSTVVFHLKQPTPDFAYNLAEGTGMGMIISPQAIQKKTALGTSTDGAGPYMLTSSGTVQGSVYTYVPNPHYYQKSAIRYSKVVIKVIADENTALSALQSGQVDATYGYPDTYKRATSSGVHGAAFPLNTTGLWLQDQTGKLVPALGNLQVRQAIQYALDRAAISKALTFGTGGPTEQTVVKDGLGYDSALDATYPYDPQKAKQLLTAAGFPQGFSMDVTVAPGADNSTVSQAVAAQLAQVGIKVNLITSTTFPQYAQAQESGKYAGTIVALGMVSMPAAMDNVFAPSALVNPRHTDFATVVSAAAAASAQTGSAASASWSAVNKQTVDQALVAPVSTEPTIYYWGKTVTGVETSAAFNPVFFKPAG